jgi:hypothetical protein
MAIALILWAINAFTPGVEPEAISLLYWSLDQLLKPIHQGLARGRSVASVVKKPVQLMSQLSSTAQVSIEQISVTSPLCFALSNLQLVDKSD